ncbi:MAG: hypothetical protein KA184_02780 [Candidatus Hydrogenedentes bacterium]|nr:hypothetical protein [Candidatus Hydrogenedentota bacterium]
MKNPIKRQLARLNRIEREAWKSFETNRDPDSLEAVLRIIDARCRLLGLYPGKRQATKAQARGEHAQ